MTSTVIVGSWLEQFSSSFQAFQVVNLGMLACDNQNMLLKDKEHARSAVLIKILNRLVNLNIVRHIKNCTAVGARLWR